MNLQVRSLADDQGLFLESLETATGAKWIDRDLRAMMWGYYKAVETAPFNNLSFAAYEADELVGLALANDVGGEVAYFGQPITLGRAERSGDPAKVDRDLIAALLAAASSRGLRLRVAHSGVIERRLRDWELALLNAHAVYQPSYVGQIDLALGEDGVKSDLRKSYKSLINFGRRNISLQMLDQTHADAAVFEAFREFHKQVAGRETRPRASWEEMYRLLVVGRAELVVGYFEGRIASCTYVFHDSQTALYGTGVYDRSLFEKPISHWPLYHSILRAADRGNKLFTLGEVYVGPDAGEKEASIAFFKKGFTSRVLMNGSWTVAPFPPDTEVADD